MKSLIRFEDTYGIADIFCAVHGTNYLDIGLVRTEMIKMDDNTYIDFGLGASWHKLTDDEAYAMIELGIERVIFVYDVDNEDGNKEKILSNKALAKCIQTHKNIFKNLGYSIEICYIPTIYAAETIMLYQFIKEQDSFKIYNLVNKYNTNAFHLNLLAYFIGEAKDNRKAKKVRNFLNIKQLKEALQNSITEGDINEMIKKWILEGCILDSQLIFHGYEAVIHRDKAEKIYNNSLGLCTDIFTLEDVEFDFEKIPVSLLTVCNKILGKETN